MSEDYALCILWCFGVVIIMWFERYSWMVVAALVVPLSYGILGIVGFLQWLLPKVLNFMIAVGWVLAGMTTFVLKDLALWLCTCLPARYQRYPTELGTSLIKWVEVRQLIREQKMSGEPNNAANAEGSEPPPEPAPEPTAYQQALDVLGLTEEGLTLQVLKQRQREFMKLLHPDLKFPTHVFAQQVNAAVQAVKRRHGWR